MSRLFARVISAGLLLFVVGCPTKLAQQQSLADRVHRATVACVALPATVASKPNPTKTKLCADALLCQSSAQSAVEAVQRAQAAVAGGSTDVAAEAQAAGLSVLADFACRRGGW